MDFATGRRLGNLGAVGGLGADDAGGLGAEVRDVSGSEIYDDSRPVSIPPPRFFSFGMPPANIPPSCGAVAIPPLSPPPPLPPVSLLLLARLAPLPLGTGGASPPGGFPNPGIAGAAPTDGPAELPESFPTIGADRSLVAAFLSLAPFVMSVKSAP